VFRTPDGASAGRAALHHTKVNRKRIKGTVRENDDGPLTPAQRRRLSNCRDARGDQLLPRVRGIGVLRNPPCRAGLAPSAARSLPPGGRAAPLPSWATSTYHRRNRGRYLIRAISARSRDLSAAHEDALVESGIVPSRMAPQRSPPLLLPVLIKPGCRDLTESSLVIRHDTDQ
jgi:hypothetical protein